MKCQSCDQAATHHVTEIVDGQALEHHVCEAHLQDLDGAAKLPEPELASSGFVAFLRDGKLGEALSDDTAREKMAAYLLPGLCLALLDERAKVKVIAAYQLMKLGKDATSAKSALRDALRDPDERVRKAGQIALDFMDAEPDWLF